MGRMGDWLKEGDKNLVTLSPQEGTLQPWRKAFIEMNLHFGRNSLIIAMLIGLICTWYGHNVALHVCSISIFSMVKTMLQFFNVHTSSYQNLNYYMMNLETKSHAP